jgi:hypothetical protein
MATLAAPLVQISYQSVRIECLVGYQAIELNALDQGGNTRNVVALARQ